MNLGLQHPLRLITVTENLPPLNVTPVFLKLLNSNKADSSEIWRKERI